MISAIQYCGDRKNPGISISNEAAFTVTSNPMSDRFQYVLCFTRKKVNIVRMLIPSHNVISRKDRNIKISSWWDGGQVASTITTRLLCQYMPDKDNFGCVIQKRKREGKSKHCELPTNLIREV